jgi:hypothetical protein
MKISQFNKVTPVSRLESNILTSYSLNLTTRPTWSYYDLVTVLWIAAPTLSVSKSIISPVSAYLLNSISDIQSWKKYLAKNKLCISIPVVIIVSAAKPNE